MACMVEQVCEHVKEILPTLDDSVVFAIGGSFSYGFADEHSDMETAGHHWCLDADNSTPCR